MNEYLKGNREHWDELVPIHLKSEFYDVEGFKSGKSSLNAVELDEVGDVSSKSLLHLQCHFGLDTLSWARMGARVTGVDFSGRAIELARSLSKELEIDARFVLSDVYDLPNALDERFDIVFTSYGVLYWLPDIKGWAKTVSHSLKADGIFYIVESHPFSHVFDDEDATDLRYRHPYFHRPEPMVLEPDGKGSYADPNATIATTEYGWNHSMGDIVNALISAGLRIEFLHEFAHGAYRQFPFMDRGDDGLGRLKNYRDGVPLMFSLKATRPDRPAAPRWQ